MEPWHLDDQATIYHGDCLEVLRELPDASVDSVVTDPPYDLTNRTVDVLGCSACGRTLGGSDGKPAVCPRCGGELTRQRSAQGKGFMGKEWDGTGVAFRADTWRECLRVLKPGGHLLAFGGTRTWHRLAVAIEDAGFEIRDSIAWMYGSGFPKSLDVSKAIDKQDAADERRRRAFRFQGWLRQWLTPQEINQITDTDMGHHLTTHPTQPFVATAEMFNKLRPHLPRYIPDEIEQLVEERTVESENFKARAKVGKRDVPVGHAFAGETFGGDSSNKVVDITAPATPDAARWQGWGTALKPAHEPVVVARKPLTGTVAGNVLEHGTGALNIDGCRIASTDSFGGGAKGTSGFAQGYAGDGWQPGSSAGRWPANVVLDEDQAAALDKQSGVTTSQGGQHSGRSGTRNMVGGFGFDRQEINRPTDSGGASRFFYVAKAPARERPKVDGIAHPTVKPLTLMRWLCRLVTPPGGVVLEPFAGSGTTIEAALMEGFRVVAIEREPDYLPLIAARLERVAQEPDDGQLTFDASA